MLSQAMLGPPKDTQNKTGASYRSVMHLSLIEELLMDDTNMGKVR